ncbi:MAG: phosphoglucosamine mutase [Deltaproteobacteria bacterium]|nr:MAG: phosphoglucosamine mutase [Deltaproteobacteria bacterium]
MGEIFGTDGVRGVANVYPMTTEMAMQLGRSAAYVFKNDQRRHKIVIGKDTRLSGYMIENAIASGICSMGVDVLLVGPLPTPGIAFITSSMRADAGVVISASHNPFQDNGIKFFSRDGFKLDDDIEARMEELIFSNGIEHLRPTAAEVGKAFRIDDAVGRYVVFMKNTFSRDLSLDGVKIAVDCANGAAYKVAPAVFEELGAELVLTGVQPNGYNINDSCGSLYPEAVAELVRDTGAHLGVAFDGDADRCICVDERGTVIDGDKLMAIFAARMLREQRLNQSTLVTTIMSNLGLEITLKSLGGRLERTAVGDRYVVERMRAGNFNLGGEQSGHIIFLDHNTTGDGLLSALQLLEVMLIEEKPLSELATIMDRYPQHLVNVRVKERKPLDAFPEIARQVKQVEEDLGSEGRLLIRPSGTEPVIRVMVEGKDEDLVVELAEEIGATIEQAMS